MPKLENLAGQVILQALKAKVSKRSVGESIDKIEKISPLGIAIFRILSVFSISYSRPILFGTDN